MTRVLRFFSFDREESPTVLLLVCFVCSLFSFLGGALLGLQNGGHYRSLAIAELSDEGQLEWNEDSFRLHQPVNTEGHLALDFKVVRSDDGNVIDVIPDGNWVIRH